MKIHRTEPDSFAGDAAPVVRAPMGQLAHQAALEHGALYERKLWQCGEHAWCLVGNGLSNQTFVEGPEGLIAIDTGESIEEMASALAQFRKINNRPIVAVIYSHFHYVGGTSALKQDEPTRWSDLKIWSHKGVVPNRLRVSGEFGPTAARGIVHQFGVLLPAQGEDALLHVGLGSFFRNPDHAPFTGGFVEPTNTFDQPTRIRLAGLDIELTPAPSDSNDSATIWFPELGVCVNNLIWPCLFNVYPIRGEPYRDPTVLLQGIDHMRALPVQHLIGAHGPPLAGAAHIAQSMTDYRDSIQFMWDQTVRGLNLGLTGPEIAHFVKLPAHFSQSYLTRQMYGLVEHHVRQIRNGLVGWFDGDESTLFALATGDRAARMIKGFGGRDSVRSQARAAMAGNDLRWALELASWLVRADADEASQAEAARPGDDDHLLMAEVLRRIAQRTTAQNLRNWCLTRALELSGTVDLSRFRKHRVRVDEVMASPPGAYVAALRVQLVPERAERIDDELGWVFDDGSICGLRLRNQVAIPTDGTSANLRIHLSLKIWAQLLAGKVSFDEALGAATIRAEGSLSRIREFLGCFDLPGLTAVQV